jgi:signal recognition particle GTPase
MSKLTKLLTPLDKQKDDSEDIFPKKPFNFGMIASKGAGKTTLLLNLLSKKGSPLYKRYNMIFLISPTAMKDDKMKELVEDIGDQFYDDMSPEILNEILEKIQQYREDNPKKKDVEFMIIFDDCLHLLKQKNNNKKLSEIMTQNRHHRVSTAILVQKWTGYLPTIVRSNLDCLAIWKTQNRKEEQSLLEEIGGNPEELKIIYDIATSEPYDFLYINQYVPNRTRYYKRFDLLFKNYD